MSRGNATGHAGRFVSRGWWLSGGAVVAVGAVLAGTVLASAAAPALPRRTPAQLLVDMQHAKLPSAMSAVVSETANLGFPSVPNIGGLSSSVLSAASLITGTHTVDIWYAGPRHVRIALPVSFGETDLRVNGNQVWLWDSQGQTATRYIPAPTRAPVPGNLRLIRPGCIAAIRPGILRQLQVRTGHVTVVAPAKALKVLRQLRLRLLRGRIKMFKLLPAGM